MFCKIIIFAGKYIQVKNITKRYLREYVCIQKYMQIMKLLLKIIKFHINK